MNLQLNNLLKFNSSACFNGLFSELQKVTDILIEEYKAEITHGMRTAEGSADIKIGLTEDDKSMLHREVVGGAWAIMDSFGTGSKMDLNNPFLDIYKSSEQYNPLRYGGNTIVGRPEGEYTNIFGEEVYSSGKNAGRNIEGYYEPITPSKAFQDALIWFKAGNRIDKRIQACIQSFNFTKYFSNR